MEAYRQDFRGVNWDYGTEMMTKQTAYLSSAQPPGQCLRSPAEISFSSAAGDSQQADMHTWNSDKSLNS